MLSAFLAYSQSNPTCPCLEDDCGDVLSSFMISGDSSVVCDGYEFTVLNTTASPGIDRYIWDWGDGTVDVVTDASSISHAYTIPDSLVCSDDKTNFVICLVAVRDCGNGNISCHSTQQPVGVIHRPKALFSSEGQICIEDELAITNVSCNANDYFWNFGDGTTSIEENPNHTFTVPGIYTVSLEVSNNCTTDFYAQTIEVVGPPVPEFTLDSSSPNNCLPVTISLTGQSDPFSSTLWEILPNDTSKWCFTDTLMSVLSTDIELFFKQAGTYDITLTASNICGMEEESLSLEIYQPPFISISSPGIFCDSVTISSDDVALFYSGAIDSFLWTFNGATSGTFSGAEFSNVTFTQSGAITLSIGSPCGPLTQTVPIIISNTEPISFGNNPTALCQNSAPVQLQANPPPPNGEWSGGGIALSPTGLLTPSLLSAGDYTFTYATGSALCPNQATIDMTILEAVDVQLTEAPPACDNLTFTPDVQYSGDIDSYSWSFPGGAPASSTAANPSGIVFSSPDTVQAIVQVSGFCGVDSDTVTIAIQQNVNLAISPVNNPYCTGTSPFSLQVNENGGTWSGTGITNQMLGTFNPAIAGPGTHTITYTLNNGACSALDSIDIVVVQSEAVSVQDTILCIDSGPVQLQASPATGSWSGTGVNSSGVFDPSQLGMAGSYPITYDYTDANGCEVQAVATVLVEALPVISLLDAVQLCLADFDADLNDLLAYQANPVGGSTVWQGPGIIDADGTFNPTQDNLALGFYTVYLQYRRNDCVVSDSAVVELIPPPVLIVTPDTSACISDGTLQLEANLMPGTWSGGPGIDAATGLIDLSEAGGGNFSYTYTYAEGNSCERSATVAVEVIDLSSLVDAGADVEICEGPASYTMQGAAPANGYWAGPGISSDGTIDLGQLQMDSVYNYQYCIESNIVSSCSACDSRTFIIHSNPEVSFEIEGLPCIGETFTLMNTSSGAVDFLWDFDDNGNTSTANSPTYSYTQQGTYTITLTGASIYNCESIASQALYVTTPPVADFILDSDEGCAPFEVMVTNNSYGDSIMQYWIVAGDTIPGAGLADIFLDSITTDVIFPVELHVSNFCGEVVQEQEVLVHPYPLVNFGINVDEGCSPLQIEFANAVLGNPDTYQWDTGNGNVYTDSLPPNQIYTTSDTAISVYTVTLIATNECGADTLSREITVYPPDVRAFIEQDTLEGCQPFTVQLQQYSTPGATISWLIIDPDGSLSGSAEPNPLVVLNSPGVHTVILYADNCGSDSDTAYFEVLPAPPVSFTHRPFICQGEPVAFTNTSLGLSGSSWDFGDGGSSTEASPVHLYDLPGEYTVTLTGFSLQNNCPATVTSTITVVGNPTAAFGASALNGCPPLSVDFSNSSQGQGPLQYAWNFGDGSSPSFEASPSHTFYESGNYAVTLTVYDADSCFADTSLLNIFVYDEPVAGFTFAGQGYCLGHDTLFLQNTSQGAVGYNWAFEGNTYTSENLALVPTQPGSSTIELIVQNIFQCYDTLSQVVEVLPSPSASFTLSPSAGCEPLTVAFNNTSSFADTYSWYFGDGGASASPFPVHTFSGNGTFEPRLITTNFNGCPNDTAIAMVTAWPKPVANFEYQKPAECGAPAEVSFLNLSTGNLNNLWDFGDTDSTTFPEPTHVYQEPGVYPLSLFVENEFGCKDTSSQLIDIFGKPVAGLQLSPRFGCEPLTVLADNQSSQAVSYVWNVESQPPSTEAVPQWIFQEAGAYDVELIAIYNDVCTDTLRISDAIRVYNSPTASFYFEVDNQENILGDVQFFNTSVDAGRYLWDLGDGTITEAFELSHEYDINRSIPVLLTAYNDNGGQYTCIDDTLQYIDPEWITTFFAPNAFAPEYGEADVRVFRPTGIGIEAYEISVYTPYGQQVWYSEELENNRPVGAWDGTFNGQLLPQGSFTWMAKVTFVNGNRRTYTGTVTLLR